jgi:hypothetical protein
MTYSDSTQSTYLPNFVKEILTRFAASRASTLRIRRISHVFTSTTQTFSAMLAPFLLLCPLPLPGLPEERTKGTRLVRQVVKRPGIPAWYVGLGPCE